MDKIYVVFWTQSGNTQAMAQAVAEGITAAGKTPELVFVSEIPADALKDEAAFALGCPAMGAEVLEESEMEPFVMAVETFAKGKKSHYLDPTDGETDSGCVTGQNVCRAPAPRS